MKFFYVREPVARTETGGYDNYFFSCTVTLELPLDKPAFQFRLPLSAVMEPGSFAPAMTSGRIDV